MAGGWVLLGWAGRQGSELVPIGMVLGRADGLMPGCSLVAHGCPVVTRAGGAPSPGYLWGSFFHLHPHHHPFQRCFSFHKTLEKHRLNVWVECPHQEGPPGLVGT